MTKFKQKQIRPPNIHKKIKLYATFLMLYIAFTPMYVFASTNAGIDATWNIIMETIIPWIEKLGVVAVVYGGIEMGLANANEDSNQKLRAGRFMVSGAMVIAIINVTKPYLL